ncbi:MAG: SUF system NifU family Fe-S cluster assembly protein [Anaerolineaceae bacterium 4572_78]|nr:MAG: SUF system NifU family Fe-S cluster assembly protein [Anaerolineaceae bacterium 4572_78]
MHDFYREIILEHYRNPSYKGTLENSSHDHCEDNPLCGDEICIQLYINQADVIEEARFTGHGCAISQASASMLMEKINGQSLSEMKKLNRDDMLEMLGIPISATRMKCAMLALKVFKMCAYGLDNVELHQLEEEEDDW